MEPLRSTEPFPRGCSIGAAILRARGPLRASKRWRQRCAPALILAITFGAAQPAVCDEGPGISAPSALAALPYYDWTGAYVGGSVGYGRGSTNDTVSDPAPSRASNVFGSMYGALHAGYNYLMPSRLLIGAEVDISFPNFLEGADVVADRATALGTATEKVDYVATVRGRLGYAVNHWLIYGTGGFAWSGVRLIESPGAFNSEDVLKRQRAGWSAGGGVEAAIGPEWTARLEYIYDNFGSVGARFASGAHFESTVDEHMLRFGLSRRLGVAEADVSSSTASAAPFTPRNWNVHGQMTFVQQGYPSFRSPYDGPSSLQGEHQSANTISATGFVGWRPWAGTELYFNPEFTEGFGLSDVRGVAAFPNGEALKSNFPSPRFNMARLFMRQTFGLGGEQETIEDGPNQISGKQDISRITVTAGKLAVTDFLNNNAVSGEPRTAFLNWNIYGGGSWDGAADKIGYTPGGLVDLNQKHWALRFAYFLLPVVANDNHFDWHIPERGEYTTELELRYSLLSQPGKLRILGWLNHGTMGSYSDAVAMPITTADYPDITLTRRQRNNYGFIVNAEQALTSDLGIFSRATWGSGLNEIVGWTDCDESISFGAVLKGTTWGRPDDRIGLAGVIEGLSPEARDYFAAGGIGILIGDGALAYHPEKVLETYYAYSLSKWATLTADYQLIDNPAYNADRGPVSVFSGRLHAEF